MHAHRQSEPLSFLFHYRFSNGSVKDFTVCLNRKTLNVIQPQRTSYPDWTALSYYQCPHCSLHEMQSPWCPIAINLVELVDAFQEFPSYEEVEMVLETKERTYLKRTTLQKGLSSLIGMYMVTSGCPVMEKLKPMVRYHLPFATQEETMYRVLSMYLLAQYFAAQHGGRPDWELKKLVALYQEIKTLNKSFSRRLGQACKKDASLNALVILDWFAETVTFSINKAVLDDLECLFAPYFSEKEEEQ